jgi:leucyl aminopeptidase
MTLNVVSHSKGGVNCDWLIGFAAENGSLDGALGAVEPALGERLGRLREAGDLSGGFGDLLELRELTGSGAKRALIVGLGDISKLTPARLELAFFIAVRKLSSKKVERVAFALPALDAKAFPPAAMARSAATAVTVGCVSQGLYKSQPDRFAFDSVAIIADGDVAGAVEEGRVLGEAMNLTRELVNRQPDDVYPEVFADRASQLGTEYGFECEVFDVPRLEQERMHSLLAVGKGSDRPSRMVVLEHRGGAKDGPVLALVGKGVTFDSGGLSLKPTDGMKTMKCDMAGAATVLGAVVAAARLKLPVNILGFAGLVENMPSGRCYKLGDVLTARNGVTIEIQNTDAEGRLVLADVLSYAVDERKVSKIVDLATLTGACVVALGEDVAGGFTNDQAWCDTVLAAAKKVGEEIWQMPMFDSYAEQLKCDVADVKNVGTRWGGAITAAKFLEKFVGETPWVHLDIAGPAFGDSPKPHRDGGATAAYVRTLVEVARNFR